MAWETMSFQGHAGMSGDKPLDEMTLALERIAAHYQNAFSRLPTRGEILYALDMVLASASGRYVSRSTPSDLLLANPSDYQGAFTDMPAPGYYIIERQATNDDVIRAILILENRNLKIRYQVIDARLTDATAEQLIQKVLLDDFADGYYDPLVDQISYVKTLDLPSGQE